MNFHPYLTPDLLTLIRTADPKGLEAKFGYGQKQSDPEWRRLEFRIDLSRGSYSYLYHRHERPIKRICLSSGIGSDSIKRRVELSNENWRELFITRFNEVLHDCESRLTASQAKQNANTERERQAAQRREAVLPLIEPAPAVVTWRCRNNGTHVVEDMFIETDAFTPEQIAQIVNLVRTFKP